MEEVQVPSNVVSIADAPRSQKSAPSQDSQQRRPKIAEIVRQFLDLLKEECDPEAFFHTPDGEPFAHIRVGGHFENWPPESSGFRTWLSHAFYRLMGISPDDKALRLLMLEFRGRAQFDGKEYPVSLRVAEQDGNVYVDLCDQRWRAIEVTPSGWDIVDDPPVRFRRSPGMFPLPEPERGGEISDIFEFLNLSTLDDEVLVLAWLIGAFLQNPHPIMALHGPQGSGKTTAGTIFRQLIDPSKAALRSTPRDERDLMISAKHSHLLGFDNLSKITDWFSDALCRIITGSGFATRRLYKNDEQMIFSARRPVVLNGIEDLASRGDLLDRMVLLRLSPISDDGRRRERELWAKFEATRPRLFGAIMDGIAAALRGRDEVVLDDPPRMADFAVIGCAVEEACGFPEGSFLAAYRRNRAEAHLTALDACPVAPEVLKLLVASRNRWEGTAAELLRRLNSAAGEEVRRDANWPKSARAVSAVLDRAKMNLEYVGITLTRLPREGGTGRRRLRLDFVTSSQRSA